MSPRSRRRLALTCTAAALVLLSPGPAAAQRTGGAPPSIPEADAPATVRIERGAPVLERPRGDSVVLGSVLPGDVVRVLNQQGAWLEVAPPAGGGATWQRGWVRADAISAADRPAIPQAGARAPRPRGPMMVRAFGQFGGVLFTARDSFEAVLDGAFGPIFGAGGQVVFPNGGFIQAGFERFSKSGARVVVSGDRLLELPFPTDVTVTPMLVTFGYRPVPRGPIAPYFGAGVGIHRYREETPALADADIDKSRFGFHFVGGAELPLLPWVSLAGEAQWAGVPKAIGDSGVSLLFEETDLGGATFRVKVIVGR